MPVPGIKYAEGRWAALREVQRSAAPTRSPQRLPPRPSHAGATSSEAAVTRGQGRDWVAYRTGGVDALASLLGLPQEASASV